MDGGLEREPPRSPRRVRSFVLREGRLTPAQRRALESLWPRYGLEPAALADLDTAFGRTAARILEIGFGDGEALLAAAAADPGRDFLGIEVHRPGIGRLLNAAARAGVGNLRVLRMDAAEAVPLLPAGALAEVRIFFPDPWPKKRHRKRRLVQPDFLDALARAVAGGGRLLLATDWEDYALAMREALEQSDAWVNAIGPGRFAPRPPERPLTRFERRGLARGHPVFDLLYLRRPR